MPRKKKRYRDPIYVPNEECELDDWIPSINKKITDIEHHTWYDIKYHQRKKPLEVETYEKTVPIIPPDSYKQQIKDLKRRKSKKKPVFICTEKMRLYPTIEQREILDNWFSAFAKMYNCTIDYLRRKIFIKKVPQIEVADKILNFRSIRCVLYDKKLDIQESTIPNKIPVHILDEAIKLAVSNYKTCITNYKADRIKKFRVSEWSHDRLKKIIMIESSFFRENTFCPSIFNEFASSKSFDDIQRTCTLQYNKDTRKYILLVPIDIKKHKIEKERISAGIDLGIRSFGTVYSKNSTYSFCNDVGNNFSISKYHYKIDMIHAILDSMKESNYATICKMHVTNGHITMSHYTKKNNRSKLKRALRKYHRKIKDKVRDMHFKVAHKLVTNFEEIYIGKLNTRKILSKNNKTLSKENKRMVGVLGPYSFSQRLEYMGYKYGTSVSKENEYLTTKTCSNCGRINELGAKKIHKCKCGMISDRDENAAKNILKVGYMNKLKKEQAEKKKKKRRTKKTKRRIIEV